MTPFKKDIANRIQTDFGEQAELVNTFLLEAIQRADNLKTDRIIRCMLYLAKGNLTELQRYIDVATYDPRDVMLWAEYEIGESKWESKRIRNFNNTFENCETIE